MPPLSLRDISPALRGRQKLVRFREKASPALRGRWRVSAGGATNALIRSGGKFSGERQKFDSEFVILCYSLPEGADASFFLCKELTPGYLNGVSGEYAPPDGYFVAEREPEAFERFDAQFPPKEKLKLPGQIF